MAVEGVLLKELEKRKEELKKQIDNYEEINLQWEIKQKELEDLKTRIENLNDEIESLNEVRNNRYVVKMEDGEQMELYGYQLEPIYDDTGEDREDTTDDTTEDVETRDSE